MPKFAALRDFAPTDEHPLQADHAGDYRTETFNQWSYDPVHDIGLNVWLASGNGTGRSFPNFMSTVLVFADGRIWTGRSEGVGNHRHGIAGGDAYLTMVEPFRTWRIDHLGLLRPGDGVQHDEPPSPADAPVLSRMRLGIDIATPPIEQGSQGDRGDAASSGTVPRTAIRYEQLCRITGTVQIGDRTIELDSYGMRSHRRNSDSIYDSGAVGHTWATALFPSGRGFHALIYRQGPSGDTGFVHGHYFDGDRYLDAEIMRLPHFSGAKAPENYDVVLAVDDLEIPVEVHTVPPLIGSIPPQGIALTRSPARFVMDGEVGGGVLERSLAPDFGNGGEYRT
jgi:hypothetical protein